MAYNTLLLNLPHKSRIQRRYMCSSYAINYLFPPQELIALGGIVKHCKNDEVSLIDAIAEGLNIEETIKKIGAIKPQLIVTISGFESFEKDIECITTLKSFFPETKFVLFGHYPTEFPGKILSKADIDYIILGEPDLVFATLYDALKNNSAVDEIESIAYKKPDGQIVVGKKTKRIPDPNILPVPAYELLKVQCYNEFYMPKPFAVIQAERGCPYQCNYCVKSFGTKLTALEPQRIIEQILYLKKIHKIKSLRFIDDTFTAVPKRVIEICRLMLENNIRLEWTCLSRADTINEQMISWMSKAGCRRIYFGIESGSEKILNLLNKRMDFAQALDNLLLCKKYDIQTGGFFLMGHPEETESDIDATIRFAIDAQLDYVSVGDLTPYPGTALFNDYRDKIDFSILPYWNNFKDPSVKDKYAYHERKFYKAFYFRRNYLIANVPSIFKNFGENMMLLRSIIKGMAVVNFKRFAGFNAVYR